MYKIGIIAPWDKKRRFKPQLIYNEKHNITFVVINDNKNYNKVLKKYKVKTVLCDNNAIIKNKSSVNICTGEKYFKNNLMYFLRKQLKIHNINAEICSLAIAFNKLDTAISEFIIRASMMVKNIILVTADTECIESLLKQLIEHYGLYVSVKDTKSIIDCNISVETEDFSISYKNNPIIININSNIIVPNEYNISIPFKVNKAALSEAVISAKQIIDN